LKGLKSQAEVDDPPRNIGARNLGKVSSPSSTCPVLRGFNQLLQGPNCTRVMKAVDGVGYGRAFTLGVQLKTVETAIAPAPATETTGPAAAVFSYPNASGANARSPLAN